jgi:hypothetical protein
MKHAGAGALAEIEPLLAQLRKVDGLVERRPGIFYRRSRAFLHFHEDPGGMYADVRLAADEDFVRMRVQTGAERARLLREVKRLGLGYRAARRPVDPPPVALGPRQTRLAPPKISDTEVSSNTA